MRKKVNGKHLNFGKSQEFIHKKRHSKKTNAANSFFNCNSKNFVDLILSKQNKTGCSSGGMTTNMFFGCCCCFGLTNHIRTRCYQCMLFFFFLLQVKSLLSNFVVILFQVDITLFFHSIDKS